MLIRILIVVLAVVAVFVVVAATRPAAFSYVRSISIAAPPAQVFARVVDFAAWPAWSPWAKLDPAMKTAYAGEPGHVGASYTWSGNDKVGEGRMTLTDVQDSSRIAIRLEFLRPFASTNESVFTFAPDGAGTRVSWSMSGTNNFMAKAASIFMNMDKMIGGDFERGLAQLKQQAETAPK